MFGHMTFFTSRNKPQGDRRIHHSRPEGIVRFKPTGEPGRWPGGRGK